MDCHPVHAIPGRLRIRVEPPEIRTDGSDDLRTLLEGRPGIRDVRLNPRCRSLIVAYDPDVVQADDLLDLLRESSRRRPASPTAPPIPRPAPERVPASTPGRSLRLAGAALVLGLVRGTSPVPWLIAAAAIPIYKRALAALARETNRLNVDVLDASAITILALRGRSGTTAVMVGLISLGDLLRDLTRQRSRRAIAGLYGTLTPTAWLIRDGITTRVDAEAVAEGDEVVIYPGECIPADGTVLAGAATVDQKMLTGEPLPVAKGPGDEALAGTVLIEGKLSMRVERAWARTTTARVIRLILDAPANETRAQRYGEVFADRVVPWSFLGAGATLLATGRVEAAASLLMIDFGTGIRIAASTTVLAAMVEAARAGILIKGGRHLERLAEVDVVVFDKTGTLTLGFPEIVAIEPRGPRFTRERVLALAAAVEDRLTHPVARAVVAEARRRGIAIPERWDAQYTIGMGVRATVGGAVVSVGSRRFLVTSGIVLDEGPERLAGGEDATTSCLFVAVDGELAGRLFYRDALRPEAPGVVRSLRRRGIEHIVMVTGDDAAVAAAIAERVGITRVVARALPEQKAAIVESFQRRGLTVAVVGDGINDSLGLMRADVGIAVHGGADVARETADVVLLEESLWKIPQAIDLARRSMRLIRQNWALNFYPNCTAVLLTVLGLSGPITTTLIHNGAALASTLNALRPLAGRSVRRSGHGAGPSPRVEGRPGLGGPA